MADADIIKLGLLWRLEKLKSTDTVPTKNLGIGTADSTTFLRGDQTWAALPGSSSGYSIVVVSTTPYIILPTSGITIYLVNCSTSSITMLFPSAVNNTATYGIKKTDSSSNTIILTPNGAQTIDGQTTQTIRFQFTEVDIFSDNANLFIK